MSRRDNDEPIRYVISTSASIGTLLSKCGSWGNMPHVNTEAAAAVASADAGDHPFKVERMTLKR